MMKHRQRDDTSSGRHRGSHHRHHHGGRPFDYGELRLLVLALIAEHPHHGYELIKLIEERFGGSYTPSPGVIYPTLSWLEDMGYAAVEAEEGARKRYRITAGGEAFLVANRAAADALLARTASADGGRTGDIPATVMRAMENFRLAMRLRLKQGPLKREAAENIAAALDAAAKAAEQN